MVNYFCYIAWQSVPLSDLLDLSDITVPPLSCWLTDGTSLCTNSLESLAWFWSNGLIAHSDPLTSLFFYSIPICCNSLHEIYYSMLLFFKIIPLSLLCAISRTWSKLVVQKMKLKYYSDSLSVCNGFPWWLR